MIPAWNYDQICDELGRAFHNRYPHREGVGIRMVGLLFAPPGARLAREHIIPSLDYFHHRSGNNIDFFCAGYRRFGFTPGERPVSNDDPPWMFSDQAFDRLRCEIEDLSNWRYSGEADLLLTNGVRDGNGGGASIDFTSAIVCDLDRMIGDRAIQSVRRFFETVFQFAENTGGDDPTWGFSDRLGGGIATSALKRAILSLLPPNLRGEYCRAKHFVVRDLNARP